MKRELIELLTYECVNDHSLALVSGGNLKNPWVDQYSIVGKRRNDDNVIPTNLNPAKK